MSIMPHHRDLLGKIKVSKRGTEISPHKYLLLLSIVTLFDQNNNHKNSFTFDELEPVFLKIFNNFFPELPSYRKMLEFPFYHLQGDGFWHLRLKKGKEELYHLYQDSSRLTKKRLLETVEEAYLDEEAYQFMQNKEFRNWVRSEINNIICAEKGMHYDIDNNSAVNLFFKEEASLYKHEQIAIDKIKHDIERAQIGKITQNILLYDKQSNAYYEYDIILIAHTGIFIVELKHWSGHIQIAQYSWTINNSYFRNDPHKNNSFKCRILKGIYQHNFRTYPDVWVESVVVLTNPEATVEGAHSPGIAAEQNMHNPTFASIQDFIAYLNKKEASESKHLLDDRQIDAIINYIDGLNNPRPGVKYNVPGYETVEYLSQKPECIELVARPISGRAKGLNRFRVFRPPYHVSQEERERFIKRAYNTLNTVSQLGDHPHIHKVWLIENENGDIIEGSDWSETGTLREFIRKQKEALSIEVVQNICRGVAQALHKAHQLNVIHRAVKPDNVLMMNNIPKLMNFDLAYQLEENRVTVLTDINKIKDDGYIAPEILSGQDIDEGTDFFSLGVIAYELFTGEKPFSSTREFTARGGRLNQQALQKLVETGVPDQVIRAINDMVFADRGARLKNGDNIVAAFSEDEEEGRASIDPVAINPELQPGDQHDVYEIQEFIGEGAAAQIYKARTIRGKNVVLKLFNREIALERIIRESEITSAVRSAYVVHCDNKIGHWKNDRYFLVLDYINGETLRKKIDRHEKPDQDTFRSVALCLMEAVAAFHGHKDDEGNDKPFLHSDIKPENIIIAKDRIPVLIDCGIAGEPRIDVYQGSAGYVPPDSVIGTDMMFSQGGDLFALGVSLWEWLLGQKPYDNPTVGDVPQFPADIGSDVPENLRGWLLKAVATTTSDRFSSIQEMQEAFINLMNMEAEPQEPTEEVTVSEETTEEKSAISQDAAVTGGAEKTVVEKLAPEPHNTFVNYLNSLSNASAGNENATAESQISYAESERSPLPEM